MLSTRMTRAVVVVVGVLAGWSALVAQEPATDAARAQELVLKTAETLEFTTNSADGRTLIFDVLGDLYTLPVAGGTATRIVGGLSFESQPKYSPDGKTIAFLTDRSGVENLWIADADGTNPRAVSKDRVDARRPLPRGLEVSTARSGHAVALHVSP